MEELDVSCVYYYYDCIYVYYFDIFWCVVMMVFESGDVESWGALYVVARCEEFL